MLGVHRSSAEVDAGEWSTYAGGRGGFGGPNRLASDGLLFRPLFRSERSEKSSSDCNVATGRRTLADAAGLDGRTDDLSFTILHMARLPALRGGFAFLSSSVGVVVHAEASFLAITSPI